MDDFVDDETLMRYICSEQKRWSIRDAVQHVKMCWSEESSSDTHLIKLSVSFNIVNAAFSVHSVRSIAKLVSRKYCTASRYNIAWSKWSVDDDVASAACFSLFASDRRRLWSLFE